MLFSRVGNFIMQTKMQGYCYKIMYLSLGNTKK